ARDIQPVTYDVLAPGLSAAEIDAAGGERPAGGDSIHELDDEPLRDLEPSLIVTQALCHVCAVSHDEVQALAVTLPDPPRVIPLDPQTSRETLSDVRTIAQATGTKDAALDLIARTARRADIIRLAVRGVARPRV